MADEEAGGMPPDRERRRRTGPPAQVTAAAALLGITAAVDAIWGVVLLVESGHVQAARDLGLHGGLALIVAAVAVAATLTVRRGPGLGRVLATAVCMVAFASGLVDLPEGLLPMGLAALIAWLLFGAKASREYFQNHIDA
ncbi:MAG TPA: hypothetical protein VIA06_07475 [Candidatus Dormibacteraeota bacterium]|jgi:hypothetical protein|nr:hypothetical protein [Candidatus Dormibacteraeota bacterium]